VKQDEDSAQELRAAWTCLPFWLLAFHLLPVLSENLIHFSHLDWFSHFCRAHYCDRQTTLLPTQMPSI